MIRIVPVTPLSGAVPGMFQIQEAFLLKQHITHPVMQMTPQTRCATADQEE